MPIIWAFHAESDGQPSNSATVARPMQAVEHAIDARRLEEFRNFCLIQRRILWHGVDDAPAQVGKSSPTRGESPAQRGAR